MHNIRELTQQKPSVLERAGPAYSRFLGALRRHPVLGALGVAAALAGEWQAVRHVRVRQEMSVLAASRVEMSAQRSRIEIDPSFDQTDFSAEAIRQVGEAFVGERMLAHDVVRVRRSLKQIPMSAEHFHGEGQYEAGHCTRSEGRGELSEVVLTPEFVGATHRVKVEILVHEFAHAIDWQNGESMTPEQRREVESALRAVLRAAPNTVYSYVNGYSGPPGSVGERSRMEELFAEFMANTVLLYPLASDDPLRQRPLRERLRTVFARAYSIPLDQADAYARLGEVIARWQGSESYFERVQQELQGLMTARELSRTERARSEAVHERTRLLNDMLQGFDPSLQTVLRIPIDHRLNAEDDTVYALQSLERIAHARREVLERERLHEDDRELSSRERRMIFAADAERARLYNERFEQDTRGMRPAWQQRLRDMEASLRDAGGGLRGLGQMEGNILEMQTHASGTRFKLRQLRHFMESARAEASTPQEYQTFVDGVRRHLHTLFSHEDARFAVEHSRAIQQAADIVSNSELFPRGDE